MQKDLGSVVNKLIFYISVGILLVFFALFAIDSIKNKEFVNLVLHEYNQTNRQDLSKLYNQKMSNFSVYFMVSSLVLILYIYYLLHKLVKKPLNLVRTNLNKTLSYTKSGKFSFERLELNTADEFEDMAQTLNEHFQVGLKLHLKADKINKELEERVARRTQEIQESLSFINLIVDEFENIVLVFQKKQLLHKNKRFSSAFENLNPNEILERQETNFTHKDRFYEISKKEVQDLTLLIITDKTSSKKELELAKDANPLTKLPGNKSINKMLHECLKATNTCLVVYFDFDNFKPFNDKYGFKLGDKAILLFAKMLFARLKNNFIGHIGGDDFFATSLKDTNEDFNTIKHLLYDFRQKVSSYYSKEEKKAQFVELTSREGEKKLYPLLSCSAVVLELCPQNFAYSIKEISQAIAKLKKRSKQEPTKYIFSSLIGEKECKK